MKNKISVFIIAALILFGGISLATGDISLVLNYGSAETDSAKITIGFASGNIDAYRGYKVQFSLDGENWESYDMVSDTWIWHQEGIFLEYYPNFFLGNTQGTKLIRAKLISPDGTEIKLQSKIKFVQKSGQSNEDFLKPNDMDVYDGVGSFTNPYLAHGSMVKIDKYLPSAKYIKVSTDGAWSKWYKVNAGKPSVNIKLSNSGLNEVYFITKDKNGIESSVQTIYYKLDQSKPKIKLITEYHDLIAIEGAIEFDIGFFDEESDNIEYEVALLAYGKEKRIKGRTPIYETGKYTYITFDLKNLPQGTFKIEVRAKDQSGNVLVRSYDVYSY
ncbi:MAG: hypothetical protein N4A40_02835 [Tissierellales bacterium]|jgi:hypothetical protein|nr:hypothetical protein [Tissierellales bacterium]